MADNINHVAAPHSFTRKSELTDSDYICVQCIELKNKLEETMEELKSARLIIDLIQQESAATVTSNQVEVSGEWMEVSPKHYVPTNKDNDKLLKRAPTKANVPLTVSNQYSIFEEDNTEEGRINHSDMDTVTLSKIRLLTKHLAIHVISWKHSVPKDFLI
jgi:hypothetical protein